MGWKSHSTTSTCYNVYWYIRHIAWIAYYHLSRRYCHFATIIKLIKCINEFVLTSWYKSNYLHSVKSSHRVARTKWYGKVVGW